MLGNDPLHGTYYNAATDLIGRNLQAGRADKAAFIDRSGTHSYGDVERLCNRFANALGTLDIRMDERIALCLLDTIDFPTAFLGAIKAGVVPIALNTLLTTEDYRFMLADSRASALIISEELLPKVAPLLDGNRSLRHVIVSGGDGHGHTRLADLIAGEGEDFSPAPTRADDMCFWLYSSGSTGKPKGTVHLQSSMAETARLYAEPIVSYSDRDIVHSAAKLFFAYGLGNALSFPMAAGATAVLHDGRPTPADIGRILVEHRPTIFCGVPTLYAALLASDDLPSDHALRICVSAGEALPAEILRRWQERMGVDILDGIGSTEMLHIFLSNRIGDVRPGVTGLEVPGYRLRILGDDGQPVAQGEVGELFVSGPTSAALYWNSRERSRHTFQGEWTASGDKFLQDENGYYVYCGRSDDMLKVGGIYVSPIEVEGALLEHASVLEAAVIGQADENELIKPKAFVVLREGHEPSSQLGDELIGHVKDHLAHYKAPRWVQFADDLPKTATGKIQRFKLRALSAEQQEERRVGAA